MTDKTAEILAALAPTQTPHGSSRWKTKAECEMKHALHYVECIRPIGGSTTMEQELGILTHACLNYVAAGIIACESALRDWRDVLEVAGNIVDEQERAVWDPFSGQETARLLDAYDAFHGTANLGFPAQAKIIGSEQELSFELAPGLPYSCRNDLLLDMFGEVVVVDHKTRARARSTSGDLERSLRCDPSIIGQSWLVMRALKLPKPPPVWLNDIIKTKTPAFERHLVRVEQRDVDAWLMAMTENLEIERERVQMGWSARRNPYACAPPFGWPCQYLKWCHGSKEERERFYERIEEKR